MAGNYICMYYSLTSSARLPARPHALILHQNWASFPSLEQPCSSSCFILLPGAGKKYMDQFLFFVSPRCRQWKQRPLAAMRSWTKYTPHCVLSTRLYMVPVRVEQHNDSTDLLFVSYTKRAEKCDLMDRSTLLFPLLSSSTLLVS
jgi:hypothetical protein